MFNDYLRHIGNTLFFMYQKPFNRDWDIRLSQLISEGKVISANRYHITFLLHGQSYSVWVANRWYCYGHLDEIGGKDIQKELQYRPRFTTMHRLNQLHTKTILGVSA